MADFAPALERVFRLEGEYSDDPGDHGGKTRYGVTEKVARASGYAGPMQELPRDMAAAIYRRQYWDPLRAGELGSQAVANVLFDFGVNAGVHAAARCFQRCLGLPDDGVVGEHTLTAANLAGPELLDAFKAAREDYYYAIVKHDPAQEHFLAGWLIRAAKPAA